MSKFKKIFKAVTSVVSGLLGDEPKMPKVVQQDPKADAAKAEEEAAKKANAARIASKRGRGSSLLASGSLGVGGSAATSSTLATGKSTLGQ